MTQGSPASFAEPQRPQPTGRLLVRLHSGQKTSEVRAALTNAVGIQSVLRTKDFKGSQNALAEAASNDAAVVIEEFGIAIVPVPAGEGAGVRMANLKGLDQVADARPEFYLFAMQDLMRRHAAWVADGLQLLAASAPGAFAAQSFGAMPLSSSPLIDTDEIAWGLKAIGADRQSHTGKGIRVAVLDTGFDFGHPDFSGRAIVSQSFGAGDVQDVQGHGTHCAGVVAGPKQPTTGRRYGVAPDAELYVGKVLGDNGSGTEGDVALGMLWAIENKCQVISMSLGRATFPDEKPDPTYEEAGTRALEAGSLIVAAAGNESRRDFGHIAPVGSPANARSILAVAAIDSGMQPAYFSCGGLNMTGGEVNVAGPGVGIHSSFPRPRLTRSLDGTSMACPHVAGVAALWAESDSSLRGRSLWDVVVRSCRPLGQKPRDVGDGLVQAPGSEMIAMKT